MTTRRGLPYIDLDRWSVALSLYSVLAGITCFWRLGAVRIVRMEPMVIDGARSMLASGDWIVPRVYGEIYTYKPALAYWLSAIPNSLLDSPPEWLLRLPFAASAFAMGLGILLLIGRFAGPRTGLFCAVASTSAFLFLQQVRLAEFDTPLTAGVGLAVAAACCALATDEETPAYWLIAYAALAFGFLAKGIPALMVFGPGLLAAAVVTRRFRRLFDWRHILAGLMLVTVIACYLYAAYRSVGPVVYEQPLIEAKMRGVGWHLRQDADVLARMTGVEVESEPVDASPFRTLWTIAAKPLLALASFLPWSLLVLPGIAVARSRRNESVVDRVLTAACAFLVASVLTFMAVPTLKIRYFLPLCVPVGIIAGIVLGAGNELSPRWLKFVRRAGLGLGILFCVGVVLLGVVPDPDERLGTLARVGLVVAGVLAAGALYPAAKRPGRAGVAALLLVAAFTALVSESLGFQIVRAAKRDLRLQGLELSGFIPPDEQVWVLGPADIVGKYGSLLYYLDRPVRAFRPRESLPANEAFCLITADRMKELEEAPGLRLVEITRVQDPYAERILGRCLRDPAVDHPVRPMHD